MSGIVVRAAAIDDAAGINAVYNPVIRDSAATFEIAEYDDAQRRDWISRHGAEVRHPLVVAATQGGSVIGFAAAAAFDRRGAYATSVKVSVFVIGDYQAAGVGGRLYQALFDALGQPASIAHMG